MIKKIVFLLLVTMPVLKAGAQVPGLEGKRFSILYSGSFYLRALGAAYDADYYASFPPGVGLNYRHNFDIDYVLGRGASIGVGFKMLRTGEDKGINYSYNIVGYADNSNNYADLSYTYSINSVNMVCKIPTLYVKSFFFRHNGLMAPLGVYQKFEIGVAITSTDGDYVSSLETKTNYTNSGYENTVSYKTTEIPYKTVSPKQLINPVFFYTIGEQKVIGKRFFFNYGFEFGFLPAWLFKNANDDFEYDNISGSGYVYDANTINENIAEQINLKVINRLQANILFNVHLGTGILLF